MIVVDEFRGRLVGVLGLAKSGRAAAQSLAAGGAEVLAWDDNEAVRKALAAELTLRNLAEADWRDIPALVLSPGIPHSFPEPHPAVVRARDADAEIIGDIELLGRAQPEARYIGITGTNGKSTTTALIAHILEAAGRRVAVGGNLGTPALSLAPLGRDGSYVLEASSFQLELITTLAFDIALLLNITPDHLDRHGDMEGYVAAKRRIFARQDKAATAIIGIDDAICRDLSDELRRTGPARVVPISVLEPVSGGVYIDSGWLIDAFRARRAAARRAQLAKRLCCLRRRAFLRHRYGRRDGRDLLVPGPRAPTRTSRHDRWRTLYQRFQGYQRGCDRKGALVLSGDLLDRRRAGQGRRDCAARAAFRTAAPYLLDRTCDGGVCCHARRIGPVYPLRRSCDRRCCGIGAGAA